ncbi:NEDD4-binding protein 2-like 2 [Centruroides sculpturatus]|uniref:NEDD4-binding protein 2-like 2 n=1 Tax=Centruroides sculpturatus TaxID=218467 RepID=UPI000C6ED211|nr:NEDD4-binding protein 2-like 2 [Centruroides sculpturatus]
MGSARNTRGRYKSEKIGRNYAKCGCNKDESLPIPGSDAPPDRIFTFPFLRDSATVDYLKKHNRIMFIIRGPSGTGKETLSSMIASLYPESDVISAKLYYSLPLAERRTRFNARKSHAWCRRRAEDGCKENKPILIIRNTNVRRWEIQPYLKLAKDFQYTVIFADCSKKFCFDPEILAKSNTQGLDAEYFETRLKQWEEVIPWYTGWFLGPADVRWLRDKSTNLLKEITAGKSALGISSGEC